MDEFAALAVPVFMAAQPQQHNYMPGFHREGNSVTFNGEFEIMEGIRLEPQQDILRHAFGIAAYNNHQHGWFLDENALYQGDEYEINIAFELAGHNEGIIEYAITITPVQPYHNPMEEDEASDAYDDDDVYSEH